MGELNFNETSGRYEQDFDGHKVYADVRRDGKTAYINHVEAAPELRGSGAAGKFMVSLMDAFKAEGLKAYPICGYAAGWLQRHSEYSDMVVKP